MTGRGRVAPSLLRSRIDTACALGLGNVARVLGYRLLLRAGVHPVQRPNTRPLSRHPFYRAPLAYRVLPVPTAWQSAACYFGWYRPGLGDGPPDWYSNPFDGSRARAADVDWWKIPDFDPATGDVKAIWEASRFDWVINLAQQAAAGSTGSVDRLNQWLADWCDRNPPYRGHNWKCAQEASVRVMHLALAGLILGAASPLEPGLVDLLFAHLRRIGPTASYATAQDNNHGTSEAAALFIGGSWLERMGMPEAAVWHRSGRVLLESRVQRLVQADGSFSQHSVNYHRLLLDTLSLVEVWTSQLGLHAFSPKYRSRAAAAARWLRAMVDPVTGDAPNFGANDGANILPLSDADYRDFRPAVQLASTLFEHGAAYPAAEPWQAHLDWLGVAPRDRLVDRPRATFDNGGIVILSVVGARAMLRYPRFRFRPGHADALHVDLWVRGENLLRDGGSYSYAAEPAVMDYFVGARGHNTVQFDDREQMVRLGRVLWGSWLRTETLLAPSATADGSTAGASYRDAWGVEHERTLFLQPDRLTVADRVAGFRSRALLRWRLRPGAWRLNGARATDGHHQLEVAADVPIVRAVIVEGWESRYYMKRSTIPVLEVELGAPGTVTTEYRWAL